MGVSDDPGNPFPIKLRCKLCKFAGSLSMQLPLRSLALVMALTALSVARADEVVRKFDGTWDTILSCPNANGALGGEGR
jgi:hypothetical protein